MKYTKEQRLDIGRRIYYSEISRYEAAEEYGISEQTARNYMRMYRDVNRLPPKHGQRSIGALSFLLFHSRFHSGRDHQRAHGQGQDQRPDTLNRWAARYSLSIIPSIQRAIPMHGTATTSPMPGRGRLAQGRGVHPCQVSRYYPIGVRANGRPPRPSPLFCDF